MLEKLRTISKMSSVDSWHVLSSSIDAG